MRGLDTAFPCVRLGLPRSASGRRLISATQLSSRIPSGALPPAMRNGMSVVSVFLPLKFNGGAVASDQPARCGMTSCPIAHKKADISRAIATVTTVWRLPLAMSLR